MAKSSLRSQFKATPIKSLRKTVEKDDVMVGANGNDYLNLEDGKTVKIRIFPAHPGHDNFYISRKCYWLSFVGDDGESHRGTVLDSIAHGGTQMDLIQEYVRYAKKKYGSDAAKMETLTKSGRDSQALLPQYSWMCYADKVREGEELKAKLWEFKKMVRDQLNKLAFSEDEEEPIEVDPFTDPDEGLPILVKYLKNPNKKRGENYYEVNFAKKPVARPLSDEELEYFSNLKPLDEILPKYSMRDYDRALEGLQNWDEENDFNLFEDDGWLEIVEKVKAQYDSDDSDDEEEKPKRKVAKKVVKNEEPDEDDSNDAEEETDEPEEEETDDSEDDEFDDMDRSALKKYIKEKDLEITVKKSMTDDDLRAAIREKVAESEDEPEEEETDDSEDDAEEEEKPTKVSLADIRKKLAGKK